MHVSIQVDLVRICKWNWPKKIFPSASNWVKLPIFWQTNVFIPDCTLACTCNRHSLTEIHSMHDGIFTVFALHINSFFPYPLLPASHSIWLWRYGAAAGQATDHAVNSAINVGITAFNVDNLGIKAVVKRTGRHTAQALLEDYKIQKKPENGTQVEKLEK